jgi:transposase
MNTDSFKLRDDERLILEEMHRACTDKRTADKIKAILLLDKGWTYSEIKEVLLLDERTLNRYKKLYKRGGVDAIVKNNYQGGFYKLSEPEIKQLKATLDTQLFSNALEVCQYVKKRFGIEYTPQGMVKTLHRLGYSYKKTRAVPGKADIEKQKRFIEGYKELRNSLSHKEKIFFADGVHPTHNMIPGYAWIKTGSERTIRCNDGRKRVNLIGFYSPQGQDLLVKEYATINAEAVIDSLKALQKKHKDLERMYIILDNARYHHSKAVREFLEGSRITFIWLPSYSPNLNLIERVWGLFKKSIIYNRYYEKFDNFREACLDYFRNRSTKFKKQLARYIPEKFTLIPEPLG